ncbi:MAG TPA: hypothetical protein VHG10_02900 [Glycomyces sp.]|nr:hypothetical protein [Glycomyces sp.]
MTPRTITTPSLLRWPAVAAAAIMTVALSGCSSPDINEDYTDVEVLAEFESRIADSVEQADGFAGFATRERELTGCFYGEDHNDQGEDEDHSTATTRYTLRDEFTDGSAVQDIAAAFERHWTELGWEVDAWRDEQTGEYNSVTGTSEDGISLLYQAGSIVSLDAFHSGCVAIDEDPIEASEPIGDVPVGEDRFQNLSNRANPDDEV